MNSVKCKNGGNLCAWLLLVLAFTISVKLEAAEFYVDRGHPSASDTNPGTEGSPWKTITKANSTLQPGDRVFVKAGIYNTTIEPARSGTASSPIVYSNFGNDVVTISNTVVGVQLIAKNYITVKGINCVYLDTFLNLEGSSHNTIEYCTFSQMRNLRLWQGSRLYWNSQYNWIHHCTFSKYGNNESASTGSVLAVGEEGNTSDNSDYNLIEESNFFHGGHDVVGIYARYTIIRNNYFHNENWDRDYGQRCLQLAGFAVNAGWNLVENNRFGYTGNPVKGGGAPGLTINTRRNIIRRNYFYHCSESGAILSYTSNYDDIPCSNKIYNNTFFNNGLSVDSPDEATCGLGFARWTGSLTITNNVVKNNLFWANRTAIDSYGVDMSKQTFSANWLQTADPKFITASTSLTSPFDVTLPDMSLFATSPCIDAGTNLTVIVTASGSGTSFTVADASYFCDGWGIVRGDQIRLSETLQSARITSINYSTQKITVDSAVTWTKNQGVSLFYTGSSPDIGAFEFNLTDSKLAPPTNLRVVVGR